MEASESLGLSRRQLQVLSYLGEGLTNKEISFRQSVSQATVAFHVAELKKKLGCKTSREILLRARELGLEGRYYDVEHDFVLAKV